jgi:hypothetical protein
MAASVVRVSAKGSGGGGGGVTSISFSFTGTPTVGNAIIVAIECGGGTVSSVTDNQGNTYSSKLQSTLTGGPWQAAIYECPNVTTSSGTFTITVNFSGATWGAGGAIEVSGLDTAGTLDKTGSVNTATNSTAPSVTASAANTNTDDLVVAVFSSATGSGTNTITGPNTGYTSIFSHGDGNLSNSGAGGYKILSAGETSSAAWTQNQSSGYAAVIATFKVAGSSAISGAVSQTLGALTSTATGTVKLAGAVSATLATIAITAAGGNPNGPIAGAVSQTLAALTSTATSSLALKAAVSQTLAAATLVAAGGQPIPSGLSLGVHAVNAATSNSSLSTPSRNTQVSGSLFFGAMFTSSSATTNTFSDNKGNTYTLIGSPTAGNSGSTTLRLYYKENGAGGTGHTVTANSNQAIGPTVWFAEALGVKLSGALHASSVVQDSVSPYNATVVCTANCIIFAVLLGSSESVATYAELNGFTIIEQDTAGTIHWTGALAYKIVAPGTHTVSFTESNSGASNGPPYAVGIAAFEERPNSGTLDTTLVGVSSTAAATLALKGTAAPTLDPVAAAGTATIALTGAANQTLAGLSISATGQVIDTTISGAANQTLAPLSATATAKLAVVGSLSATLAGVSRTATGALKISASASVTLANLGFTATGEHIFPPTDVVGSLNASLEDLVLATTAHLAIKGAASIALAPLTLSSQVHGPSSIDGSPSYTISTAYGSVMLYHRGDHRLFVIAKT